MGKRDGMQDIVCFRLGPGSILIDQHKPPPHTAHHQSVGRSRTDKATSDNSCFHRTS
jgi:hypothetical protein